MVDGALEASVIGSYTRFGIAARRALGLEGWDERPLPRLDGRVVVLTGATSGLGRAAADALCALGARLELVVRDLARGEAAVTELRGAYPGADVALVQADLGSLAEVRRAAETIAARHERVDVLIHNAGALDDVRSVSPEGIETTVATHLVGPALLTRLLLPHLRRARVLAGEAARVLFVTSGGMYTEALDVGRLEMPADDYDGVTAYARAKRAQMAFVSILADALPSEEIVVHAMHPGWADTPGVARSLPRFRAVLGPLLRSPAEGADTLVYLAAAPGPPLARSGALWLDRFVRPPHRSARTRRADTSEARAALLRWLEERGAWSAAAITRAG